VSFARSSRVPQLCIQLRSQLEATENWSATCTFTDRTSSMETLQTLHLVFSAAGTVLPVVVAIHVLLSRKRVYPLWAKIIWIVAIPIGLSWGFLGWILAHQGSYQVGDSMYHKLAEMRWFPWAVIVGFVTIFAIATPYRDFGSEKRKALRA